MSTPQNPFSLKGHAALVTGSTRGIGEAIANSIEAAGGGVVRHGRTAEPGQKDVVLADLLEEGAVDRLLKEAFELQPELDLLVCNAGSFFDTNFLQMTPERFEKTMKLNVQQVYFLLQRFAQELVARKREGAVVIVSSTNGFFSEEGSTAYDASKGALVMLTRSAAQSLAPHGIRVNGVAPGLIRTPLTGGWMDNKPEKVEHYHRKIFLRRIGTSDDCAGPTVFLLSDAARYMVGQVLVVDGGLTVGQIGDMPA